MFINIRNSLRLPDYMQDAEKILRLPLIFTLIYVFGGIFAGLHYPYPNKLFVLFDLNATLTTPREIPDS